MQPLDPRPQRSDTPAVRGPTRLCYNGVALSATTAFSRLGAVKSHWSGREMIRKTELPGDIDVRLSSVGALLAAREEVAFAYLFGGQAGERRPLSDVDLAVYLKGGLDFDDCHAALLALLVRHLGTDEVDLVLLNHAPIALLGRILRQRRVILDRDPYLRHRFESRVIREFQDFGAFERKFLDRRFHRG